MRGFSKTAAEMGAACARKARSQHGWSCGFTHAPAWGRCKFKQLLAHLSLRWLVLHVCHGCLVLLSTVAIAMSMTKTCTRLAGKRNTGLWFGGWMMEAIGA